MIPPPIVRTCLTFIILTSCVCAQPKAGESPADHLPAHIVRLTSFGERADWPLATQTRDGSVACTRLTYFSDYLGYQATNPVVSDDSRFIAFQMAKTGDETGVGHGIFVYDIAQAPVGTP